LKFGVTLKRLKILRTEGVECGELAFEVRLTEAELRNDVPSLEACQTGLAVIQQ
jgi:hypothetical protein